MSNKKSVEDDPDGVVNINVGVLGHVDSGKTSLVKTLSTLLSTASLDKSVQSRQRGITLDLGFSAFTMPMPESFGFDPEEKKKLQVTLVDCPGHASLIRTIIGGAQIIDMVLLVVDATKGIQTQTAECLVIAEMTTPHLVLVMNKVDLFPPEQREDRIQAMEQKLRGTLSRTTFGRDAPMIAVSACVGGEKDASLKHNNHTIVTHNIEGLLDLLQSQLRPPARFQTKPLEKPPPFYFAVDHCFPIKGQGTVLTGTCLSGTCAPGDIVEVPSHQLQRKIKSMQMFRRKIQRINQGDRAGVCVANLDPNLMERGILAAPGAVTLWKGAIALVRKVRYYNGSLKNKHANKFHISVGHSTVMATTTFFGFDELQQIDQSNTSDNEHTNNNNDDKVSSSLGGNAELAGLPKLTFDYDQDFLQQDEYYTQSNDEKETNGKSSTSNNSLYMPLHWAVLEFHTPVYCPKDSLIIGSRLDTDVTSHSCRLAFSGRLIDKCSDRTLIKWYTKKERVGNVCRLGEPYQRNDDGAVVRYEVYGTDLFKKETNMTQFIGMQLETPYQDEIGVIQSSFGTSGKFKVHFPAGTRVKDGDKLYLRFKRYVHDDEKKMRQNDHKLPKPRVGTRMQPVEDNTKKDKRKKNTNKKHQESKNNNHAVILTGEISSYKGDAMENGNYAIVIVSGLFTPEINIRNHVGTKVHVGNEEGSIVGPFGKAGKCKVSFEPNGIQVPIGTKVKMEKV